MNAYEPKNLDTVEFGTIRYIIDAEGDPWFVGLDIVKATGINRSGAFDNVDTSEKILLPIKMPTRGAPICTMLSPQGVCQMMRGRSSTNAKTFAEWFTQVDGIIKPSDGQADAKREPALMEAECEAFKAELSGLYDKFLALCREVQSMRAMSIDISGLSDEDAKLVYEIVNKLSG